MTTAAVLRIPARTKALRQPNSVPTLPNRNDNDAPTVKELVYHAAIRARIVPSTPWVSACKPGIYMPASAMPATARNPSAGSRLSHSATPKQDSALSMLDAR
jgi:hypothetical protein